MSGPWHMGWGGKERVWQSSGAGAAGGLTPGWWRQPGEAGRTRSRVSVARAGASSQGRDTVQDPAGQYAGNLQLWGIHKMQWTVLQTTKL